MHLPVAQLTPPWEWRGHHPQMEGGGSSLHKAGFEFATSWCQSSALTSWSNYLSVYALYSVMETCVYFTVDQINPAVIRMTSLKLGKIADSPYVCWPHLILTNKQTILIWPRERCKWKYTIVFDIFCQVSYIDFNQVCPEQGLLLNCYEFTILIWKFWYQMIWLAFKCPHYHGCYFYH